MAENNLNEIVDPILYIWLDDTIEKSGLGRETKASIQQMVKGRLQTFTDPDECIDYITTEIAIQRIVFIVSNKFGQIIIPLIYDIPQIEIVYVYCGRRQIAESWATSHLKVRGIFTKKQELLHQIRDDIGGCENDDDLPMSAFHLNEQQNSLQKLSPESTKFMWYQALLAVLLLVSKYCNSKDEMVIESRACYPNDEIEKKRINDFEQNYNAERAFWWYSSNSFVYRLLNRSLRTQNIETIFKFRFFINDLHNQIQKLFQQFLTGHTEQNLKVYRGQKMSKDEIELLRNNVDGIISMNSFLSTTQVKQVAEIFADTDNQSNEISPLQSVLFIIDIYDINQDTTPFAFIKRYACNRDEEEVLFTIGAIFKIESVKQEKNVWHVHLKLSRQQNKQHKDFSSYMIKQMGSEPGPTSFGWILYRMADFPAAERYAKYILKQSSLDDKDIGDAYNLLGLIYKDVKRLEEAVDCYEKALEAYSRSSRSGSSQVIAIHYNAGLAYLALGDNRLAEDHRIEAHTLLINSAQSNNPLLISMTDSLKAKILTVYGDFNNALKSLKTALTEKQKTLPPNHPSFASLFNEMGIVYEKMSNDDTALECFQQAVDICSRCLLDNHFDLAEYRANIGRIYYKRKQYTSALEQFQSALTIITDATRDENDNMVILLQCISDINEKLYPLPDT